MTTYKRAIATALAALAMTITLWACGPSTEQGPCFTPSEDAPVTCHLDPTKRYEWDHGMWHTTNRTSAPTGAELTATESSYDGRG